MPRLCSSLVSLLSFVALHANALPPQPAGAEFQVNTYTTNRQEWTAVAAAPDGDFVVVWRSHGSVGDDTHFTSLQGQRYSADGTPQGAQFQVNTYTPGEISDPSVAAAGNGDFVVVWESVGSSETDTSGTSIHGQRFASDGSPQGSQFQINTFTTGDQRDARVAADADGDFVVAWSSVQGYYPQVRARRFASDGSAQGPDFEVAPFISYDPSVAADFFGNFIVVWDDGPQIQAQRFASNGSAQGPTFQSTPIPTTDGLPWRLGGVETSSSRGAAAIGRRTRVARASRANASQRTAPPRAGSSR